jgi:hypothetical protein
MRHDDDCVITRTTTKKDSVTHISTPQTQTFPSFKCRLGRSNGTVTQGTPQGTYVQQLRLYIPNINADIKAGDMATIGTSKYIVQNSYKVNRHHIECDVVYKEEV